MRDERDPADGDRAWAEEQRKRERQWDERARRCRGESAGQVLVAVIRRLAENPGDWWATGATGSSGAEAHVYRTSRPRTLLVVGENDLSDGLRELLASGAAAGWDLFRIPDARTPLHELEAVLRPVSGARYANILRRAHFNYAEEVAALPGDCLRDFEGVGGKFVATVRMALAALDPDARRAPAPPGGSETAGDGPPAVPGWLADQAFMAAFAKVSRWAASQRGAERLGDVLLLAAEPGEVPGEVAAAWDRVSRRPLSLLGAGGDVDLDILAETLLGQLSGIHRTILTARTFASAPCPAESLAAGLGLDPGQAEAMERTALQEITRNAAEDQFAPLRWRAESGGTAGVSELTAKILGWIAGHPVCGPGGTAPGEPA